ncbi:PiggyBac transposable element-derived protein 3 [Plakobranchus ocellatus]|uniref:PiggyBac transposable element-derived protein 3 n=1 Tax=Plakobranchus ocellatus TaxID=259542 RepID=A0AAV4ACB5_9GAST|nr:PiggyBac transposable element-derived protein 3 [Plakobranchus ocellatus]
MKKADRGNLDIGVVIVRWNVNSVVTVGSTQFGVFPTGVVSCWSKQDRQQIQYLSQETSQIYNLSILLIKKKSSASLMYDKEFSVRTARSQQDDIRNFRPSSGHDLGKE